MGFSGPLPAVAEPVLFSYNIAFLNRQKSYLKVTFCHYNFAVLFPALFACAHLLNIASKTNRKIGL